MLKYIPIKCPITVVCEHKMGEGKTSPPLQSGQYFNKLCHNTGYIAMETNGLTQPPPDLKVVLVKKWW